MDAEDLKSFTQRVKILLIMGYRVLVILIFCFFAFGCKSNINREPEIQLVYAPDTVQSKTSFEVKLRVVDPENDMVRLRLDFGDGFVSQYSEYKPSRTVFNFTYVYTGSGDFNIFADAEDINGNYTGWRFIKRIVVR